MLNNLSPEFHIKTLSKRYHLNKVLKKTQPNWIIIPEKLPRGPKDLACKKQGSNGIQVARKWIDKDEQRRAIVIVNILDDSNIQHLDHRLTFIEQRDLNSAFFLDMIEAGSKKVPLIPPTTISCGLSKNPYGNLVLQPLLSRPPKGPLTNFVTQKIFKEEKTHNFMAVFEQTDNAHHSYKNALQSDTIELVKINICKTGFILHKDINQSIFFNSLRAVLKEVLNKINPAPEQQHLFAPIHLHIYPDNNTFSTPIDIAMSQDEDPTKKALISLCPITWFLPTDSMPIEENNVTCPEHFKCLYLDTLIPDAHCNCQQLSENICGHPENVTLVTHKTQLCNQLHVISENGGIKNRQWAYILGHGVHSQDEAKTGIIISTQENDDERIVTAHDLAPKAGETGAAFVFYNCCELGYHNPNPNGFFGGFALAILKLEHCSELICNRWAVKQKSAQALAANFFKTKPRTLYGRATSLHRARIETGRIFRSEVSWIAPIHVVAYRE